MNLEWYVDRTAYVAVVEPASVGGAENTAPTVAPPATLYPTPPIKPTPGEFDLSGIGARLRVDEALAGSAPPLFDIDAPGREATERQLREEEANPGFVFPCPAGFLVPRYEMDQRYLVVAGYWEGDERLQTLLKYEVEGDQVLIGGSSDDFGWQLILTAPNHKAYFSDVLFESWGPDQNGVEIGRIDAESVPLAQFRAAVKGIFVNAPATPATATPLPATPTPPPMQSVTAGVIRPPDTGEGGLR